MVVVVVLLLVLAGCSGSGRAQTNEIPPAQLDATIPPLLDVWQPRSCSAPYTYETLGWSALRRSEYSEVTDHVITMDPGDAGYAWTIYDLATAGHPPLELSAELEIEDGQVWLGLSDFSAGSWRFYPPVITTGSHELELSAVNAADDDTVYLAIVSSPESLVTINRILLTIDQPGWLIYTLADDGALWADVEMFVQDQKPMIAYGPCQAAIRFLRAHASFPTGPEQWTAMVVDSEPEPAHVGGPLAAGLVDGRPAVAYLETEEELVKYAYSQVAEPSEEDDWFSMTVYDALQAPAQLGLADYDGRPCLAFTRQYGKLLFAEAPSSTPQPVDWTASEVIGEDDLGSSPSLAIAGGRPVILCHGVFEDSDGAYYLRPNVESPAAPADWDHHIAYGFGGAGTQNSLYIKQLKPTGYRPVAAFLNHYIYKLLVVGVAEIGIPLNVGDWALSHLEDDVVDNSICVSDTLPFVIYSVDTEGAEAIKCAWAQLSTPDGHDDWDYFVLEDGAYGSVAAVSIMGTPVIAWRDYNAGVLKFGWYDE